jgi:tRNA A-37 threonylcarbamoyl transferase component Bud32
MAIPGGRLIAAEGDAETFRAFDSLVSYRRVVKDLRHKRTEEVRLGYRTFLVKTYKAGPWPRRLKTALFGSRGIHELRMSDAVLRLGLPTAPVAAAGERGGESWVAVEVIPGAEQLQKVLLAESTPPARRRELLLSYGKFARRLHDAGVSQYDFNPSNVLVDQSGFRVIDFEKMRIYGRPVPERVRMRTLAKMNRIPGLTRTDRMRFLKGYLEAHVVDRLRRKEIAARVRRLGREQEALDAKRSERRCVRENRDFAAFDFGGVSGFHRKPREEGPEAGITPEELRRAIEAPEGASPFRLQEAGDALAEWKRANRESRGGKAAPLAVFLRKGERRGAVVYPK